MKLKVSISKKQLRSAGRLGKKVGIRFGKALGKKVTDIALTRGGAALGGAVGALAGPTGAEIGSEIGGFTGKFAAKEINNLY